ncbi:MAG: carbon starvation protein A, partial [Candidatus Omnitrophota bacterium]
MNVSVIAIGALILLGGAYFVYGRRLDKNFGIDPKRDTPSHTQADGLDYIAAKHWTVLFGHHFASIAGAGPIVGPIIAVSLWGWGPSILWIILGTIFLGGVHDFGSLLVSMRHQANSIAEISKELISRRAKIFFSTFVFLALILVIAVFAVLCAKTFVVQPEIVLPSLGLIPLAIFAGIGFYNLKLNQLFVTFLSLIILGVLLFLGIYFPVKITIPQVFNFWLVILFLYSYLASVLPVNILLQPRDYLSSFLLFFGLVLGYLGIFVSSPRINLPVYISWNTESGLLWPMLFVTIACGAISGFHSLIASGTTSKQISSEKDVRKIGYGAMVLEGVLAVMTVLVIAGSFSSQSSLNEVLQNKGGPIRAFGEGFGKLTHSFLKGHG